MRVLKAHDIASAHELAVKFVLEKGIAIITEDGEATIEIAPLSLVIDEPLKGKMISSACRFQTLFMDQYANALLKGTDNIFEYDYHERLFRWGQGLTLNGVTISTDQIEYMIKKLRNTKESRRAIAVIWNPPVDETRKDCPCLQLIQCIIRKNSLKMSVVFRSNDMLTAAGANMYALVKLQEHIAATLNVSCGTYTHISLVPHIYFQRDISDIVPFCENKNKIHPVAEVCTLCGKCS